MSTFPAYRRPLFASSVSAVAALAWIALIVWGRSPYARYLDHGAGLAADGIAVAPVAVLGWVVMIVAMMLPTSLPLIEMFRRMTAGRDDRGRLLALLIAGYLGVWTAFGAVVHAGDLVLHQLVGGSGRFIGPGVLGLAGLYQLSALKERCLAKCRSPRLFIAGRWHGRDPRREALALGAHHGLWCLGCCWTLMLVMFAVGVGNLGWMLGLGAIMAVEKNATWGRRLSAPVGITLLATAVAAAA